MRIDVVKTSLRHEKYKSTARIPTHVSNAQQTRLPRNDKTSGNELKQSVTKRKSTGKPRLSPLRIIARTRKMKGLTTH
ncbi:hypothetical protein [Burkholderia cepacia]|uniref:hypothetical protein n=1 Tax=Burkholderia cepacia TaxID=292 RepID=UPI000AA85B28|nr:hypothetical protein [Burkholderia cepacia]